jgi:hypothetical protein
MYGNRDQMNKAIYMRNLVRHQALVRGGTPFGRLQAPQRYYGDTFVPTTGTQADTVMATGYSTTVPSGTMFDVSSVYQTGGGAQLDLALMNRQKRRRKALMGLALRAFMKQRKGMVLTRREEMALQRVGGMSALVQFFSPQGIDIETASEEGALPEISAEDKALVDEEMGMSELEGEKMGFGTVLLIAGGVGLGLFLLGKAL